MAIDTAQKRRSAAGLPFFPCGPGVTPNVSKPAAWRQESGWGYSGIAVGTAEDTTVYIDIGAFTLSPRSTSHTVSPRSTIHTLSPRTTRHTVTNE